MADISVLPTYKLSELARTHVTVSLSGDGSDEMLLGYGKHLVELLRSHYMKLPAAMSSNLIQPLISLMPSFHWRVHKFKNALNHVADPFTYRALSMFAVFQEDVKQEILSHSFYQPLKEYQTVDIFDEIIKHQPKDDTVNLISYLDFKFRLVDQLLLKLDKVPMAVGLEARAPFLDYRLLEYIVKVPPKVRLHLFTKKYLLKRAAKQWLPSDVVNRKKKGFGFPIASWLRDGRTTYFHDILLDEKTARRGYFNRPAVESLLKNASKGERHVALALTVLLFFELWCRTFLEGEYCP